MSRSSYLVDNWIQNLKLRAKHGEDTQLLAYSVVETIRVSRLSFKQCIECEDDKTSAGCWEDPSMQGHEYWEKAQEAGRRRIIWGARGDMRMLSWKPRVNVSKLYSPTDSNISKKSGKRTANIIFSFAINGITGKLNLISFSKMMGRSRLQRIRVRGRWEGKTVNEQKHSFENFKSVMFQNVDT